MMKVRDVMSDDVVTLHAESPIVDAQELMGWRRIRHLPVVRGGKLVGLVTHRDLMRSVMSPQGSKDWVKQQIHNATINVEKIMHAHIATIGPDAELVDAARTLRHAKYGCLPVVDDGKLVGIITESDFVHLAQILLEQVVNELPEVADKLKQLLDDDDA